MTMPHMCPAKAVAEQLVFGSGQFVVPASVTAANLQIQQGFLTTGAPGTSQLTPTSTVSPAAARIPVFANPDSTQAGNAANMVALPRGVASGVTGTPGSEFLLDFSGYPADIVYAWSCLYKQARGVNTAQAMISAVDNVNKLVYIQVMNIAGSAALAAPTGSIIGYQVTFKDTFSA